MLDNVTFLAATASALNLVDFVKPVLALIAIGAYLRLIGSTLEKDLRYFNFNVAVWNATFLVSAVVAFGVMLLIPYFLAGFPAMIVIMLAPLLVYWKYRNDNVQNESQKFTLSSVSLGDRMAARKSRSVQKSASAVLLSAKFAELQVPDEGDPRRAIHLALEDLLLPAIEARATRLELGATAKGGSASQIVDGVRYKREALATETAASVLDYLKQAAGLPIEERRKKLRGRCGIRLRESGKTITLDLVTSGSSQGLTLRIDFDRDKQLDRDFEALGLEKEQAKVLATTVEAESRHGVILVGMGPGQGLTSTLTALLTRHDAYTCNIKTIERDVQRLIEGVDHAEWDASKPDVDFATQLRSIIRRGPDIVMVSDLQDPGTGAQAALVGIDGPLVYVGVQTKDGIPGTITDWFRSVGDLKQAATPLVTVITGRIMRKLCPECRTPFSPSPDQAKKLGIKDPSIQLHRQSGRVQIKNKIEECPLCRGTGFFGTVGVYEVMPIDREARKMLAGGDLKAAYTHARRSLGMMLMQEAALRKVARGETSLEEVARVLSPGKAGDKSPAGASA